MLLTNTKWNKRIPDHLVGGDLRFTKTGQLLINKSFIVYNYIMYSALSFPYGGMCKLSAFNSLKLLPPLFTMRKTWKVVIWSIIIKKSRSKSANLFLNSFLELKNPGLIKVPEFIGWNRLNSEKGRITPKVKEIKPVKTGPAIINNN